MKYLIPSERPDVGQFITHVFGNKILPMKHAVRHTWLLHRLCTSTRGRGYHAHGNKCRSLCRSRNLFYVQAAAYRIEIPPASHFGRQITKKLKAERRLTHRWIHLIVVQNQLLSGVSRLVVPSHQLPIQQLKGEKSKGMLFSFFHVLLLPKHRFAHITSCWQYYTFRNYVWRFGDRKSTR